MVAQDRLRYAPPAMIGEGNPRFVRWQGRTITQLGFVNNTVLVLTTASLGFAVDRDVGGASQCFLWLGILLLGTSVFLALRCAWNRLCDFRETAQLAKGEMRLVEEAELRRKTKERGECTWRLLKGQLLSFGIGALFVVVAVAFG